MMRGIFEQATEVVSSDDLKETYEVTRRWQDGAGKMLVLELYPTIAADRPGELDLSAMHLMNHIHQLGGYGEARVMNLFPIVCRNGKPLSKRLKESTENLAYIEEAFDRAKEEGTDIVIAWGTTWKDLAAARSVKTEILEMIKERGLADKTFHIVTPDLDTHDQEGTHPLYLGLRYSREEWELERFPVDKVLKELKERAKRKPATKKPAGKGKAEEKGTAEKGSGTGKKWKDFLEVLEGRPVGSGSTGGTGEGQGAEEGPEPSAGTDDTGTGPSDGAIQGQDDEGKGQNTSERAEQELAAKGDPEVPAGEPQAIAPESSPDAPSKKEKKRPGRRKKADVPKNS